MALVTHRPSQLGGDLELLLPPARGIRRRDRLLGPFSRLSVH